MADAHDDSTTDTNEEAGRSNHLPQHASAKHARQPIKDTPETETTETVEPVAAGKSGKTGPHHKLWSWARAHKPISIPLAVVVLLAILFGVPFTRYALLGTVLHSDFSVMVTDSQTHKPVSSAVVSLEGKAAKTNGSGVATIHAKLGNAKLLVTKKYYKDTSQGVVVPLGKQHKPLAMQITATGRQVPVTVLNKISGKPVANATISAQGTEAKTDSKGKTTMVLPADKTTVAAKLSGNGFNAADVTVKVTLADDPANTFRITPTGKVFFLSNASGTIDVVKTNLDGSDRQTVLAGTGKEDKFTTSLLASQDWRFLALLAKRDSDQAKVYLIETNTGKVTTMDEGDVDFTLDGWDGDTFVYQVNRHGLQAWQSKAQALKSFDATTKKLNTLYETQAGGTDQGNYWHEEIGGAYIVDGSVVFPTNIDVSQSSMATGRAATMRQVDPDGSNAKTVKTFSFPLPNYFYFYPYSLTISTVVYAPNELAFAPSTYNFGNVPYNTHAWHYEKGQLTETGSDNLYPSNGGSYPTYLFAPNNKQTFWVEQRDGKNTLLLGNSEGNAPHTVVASTELVPYGWYTGDYVLASKNGSELYVLPADGVTSDAQALKISDYYRPAVTYPGYGGGYGGL